MKIVFVGHKIQDLGGFTENAIQKEIKSTIENVLKADKSHIVLTSMSLGIEMWAAKLAFTNKVPYHVYVPFKDYHSKWPFATRKEYSELLKHAGKRIVLDDGAFDVKKLLAKEVAMLEEADIIYSFYKEETKLLNKFSKKVKCILPLGEKDDWFISI
jgi:uncharacterized phage-like protein YoqJ